MICPNCQSEFPEGVKFCSACGTPLADPVGKVEEAASEVNEAVSEVVEVDPSDMPSASFDPGAPIALPRQNDTGVDIVTDIPAEPAVVAPIEEVLPEYPQTAPAVETAPVIAPAPVVAPAPAPAPAPVLTPAPISLTPETVPAPVVTANAPAESGKSDDKSSDQKVLKTGTAFWLMLLFAIPVVGLIFAIIFSAAGKKCQSRKNFARAALIWQILLICIILSLVILCSFFCEGLFDAVVNGNAYDVIDELDNIFHCF